MDELADFWVHTVQVQTYLGSGAQGDVWAPAVTKTCFVDDNTKLVRDTKSGEQIVSSSTVYGPLGDADTYVTGSLVTLPAGRVARVLGCSLGDPGTLGLPSYVEVNLV